MAKEKLIQTISTIARALGIIEGVACGLDGGAAAALVDAVEMMDAAVKEITDGK